MEKIGHFKCAPAALRPYKLQIADEQQGLLLLALRSEVKDLDKKLQETEDKQSDVAGILASCYQV